MKPWKVIFFLAVIVTGCQEEQQEILFPAIPAERSGINFSNSLIESDTFNIVDYLYYYNGGGVALGDINNDGLVDIYLSSNEGTNALYLNLGDLQFRDITSTSGVGSGGMWKTGVSMADINNDGWLDIYVCRVGNYKGIYGKNELFINNGDLTFSEKAAEWNIDFSGFSTQAAFFDLENDGDLDMYLLNHAVHTPRSYGDASLRQDFDSLSGDRLYRNDGSSFTDISRQSGIYQSQVGYGLGVGLSDIDKNGFTDVFVSNDFSENDYLYLNNADGTFTESWDQAATHTSRFSMGNDLADFNNDGATDIMTLDMLPQDEVVRKRSAGDDPYEIFKLKLSFGYMNQYSRNTLQMNRGDGTFSDVAMMAGVHATDWSWAPLLADFDNDRLKDIFISNGIARRPNDLDYIDFISNEKIQNNPELSDQEFIAEMPDGTVSNYFFRNSGDLTFEDVSNVWGGSTQEITNGAAYADLDNDGDLDLVLNNLNAQAVIHENNTSQEFNFLNIQLKGVSSNDRAIGAKIEVYLDRSIQYFENFPTRGFQSSVDQRIHIGLGNSDKVDSLRITWPGGSDTVMYDITSNQFLLVTEPVLREKAPNSNQEKWVENIDPRQIGIDYVHTDNNFNEFNREALIPHMNSYEGPPVAVGDVNGDGDQDIFFGGAKHQSGLIYIQSNGGFIGEVRDFIEDKQAEDVAAEFFDFENDGDLDLIVLSGGNEFDGESPNRKPRLYINNQGKFRKLKNAFPSIYSNGGCLAIHDFDGDGLQDVFIGSATEPWKYGVSPSSFLLRNTGQGFDNVSEMLPESGHLGMINSALWVDVLGDADKELIVAGEWTGVQVIPIKDGKAQTIPNSLGWWQSLKAVDYDGDGDLDLLAGNLGLNSKLKASKENPLKLYLSDLDKNGQLDQVLTHVINGKESIFPTKMEITKQVPALKKEYQSYEAYATAEVRAILGQVGIKNFLEIEELRSGVFINQGDSWRVPGISRIMQISMLKDFLSIRRDNQMLLVAAGNFYKSSVQEGWYDADKGSLLQWEDGEYRRLGNENIGLNLEGEVRDLESIIIDEEIYIIGGRNDQAPQILKFKGPK